MFTTYSKSKGSYEIVKTRDIFNQPLTSSSSESESDEIPSSSGKIESPKKLQKDTKKSQKSTESEPSSSELNLDDYDIIDTTVLEVDKSKEVTSQEAISSSKPHEKNSREEQSDEYDSEESAEDNDQESEDESDTEQTGWLGISAMVAALYTVKSYLFPSDE